MQKADFVWLDKIREGNAEESDKGDETEGGVVGEL